MKHTITAPERNYGYLVCPTFSGLNTEHVFNGVWLERASGDMDFFDKNSNKERIHIHNGAKNRVDGLTAVWNEIGDEIDVTYDGENNVIKIKEFAPDPSEEELAKQAAKIRNMMRNGLIR